mmetsp:Transcript_41124/g.117308  ORF Transcript_41124/g.117308 Transcript_41124/m.117308 type:complete len:322 (+) Transcript_41124:104-1069(+)
MQLPQPHKLGDHWVRAHGAALRAQQQVEREVGHCVEDQAGLGPHVPDARLWHASHGLRCQKGQHVSHALQLLLEIGHERDQFRSLAPQEPAARALREPRQVARGGALGLCGKHCLELGAHGAGPTRRCHLVRSLRSASTGSNRPQQRHQGVTNPCKAPSSQLLQAPCLFQHQPLITCSIRCVTGVVAAVELATAPAPRGGAPAQPLVVVSLSISALFLVACVLGGLALPGLLALTLIVVYVHDFLLECVVQGVRPFRCVAIVVQPQNLVCRVIKHLEARLPHTATARTSATRASASTPTALATTSHCTGWEGNGRCAPTCA